MRLLDLFVFKYNRTDFHELNLDWIISDMRTLAETLQNFISLNTIKYADPIQWNITTQYEANTVVVNPSTGTAYLSTHPVPSGVALTNTDYWTVIFDLDIAQANNNITLRDDGNNVLSSFTSVVGDWLLWNGTLYKVIADIGLSQAYVVGYNIERYTVELFIKDYIAAINTIIGDLDDLQTTDKTSVVNAINDCLDIFNTIIGNLNDLQTTDKDSVVDAINECLTIINNISTNVIGDLDNLQTTDKTSVVNAINSVVGDVVSSLVFTSPEKFGSVGDGVADDTEAVQAAIDDAITNKKKLLLTKSYLVNTLFIDNAIDISGGGTLKGQPLRYDTTLSAISNTDRFFTTNNPDYYHKNTLLTIHDSNNNQTFVVTDVTDNVISIAPHFYEASADTVVSFAAGATVNIHTTIIEISASNTYMASDTVISDISVHDINIAGSQLGYDNTKFIILDGRYNGLIYAHSIKNSFFDNINGSDCVSNALAFMGTCTNLHVTNNNIKNCHSYFESTTETECGIVFHWSQRFVGSSYTPSDCIISGNVIADCYDGLFLSACTRMNVTGNTIEDIIFRGLMLYAGDNTYPSRNHVVDGNVFKNCAQSSNNIGVIYVSTTIQTIISNNNILTGTNGIVIGKGDDLEIIGNEFIGFTNSGITDYNGYRHNIKSNYFIVGSGAVADIIINKQDAGNSYINIESNTYSGATSSGAAVKIDNGINIKLMNEMLHATPSYLVKADTANVSLGNVLIMNCYVNAGVALAAELAVLNYVDCINSSNTRVSNIT